MSDPEILAAYPDLEVEDIREAVRYAAEASVSASCRSSSPREVSDR